HPCPYFVVDRKCIHSSRRRHTQSKRDWSSDVCSSDLINLKECRILKRLGVLLLLGFITMMVIGCSEDTGGNQGKASNNNDDLESFKVGYMPNFASTYGVISSIENGNFEDKGLDLELVEFEDGTTII